MQYVITVSRILCCIFPHNWIFKCVKVIRIYTLQHEFLVQNNLLLLIVTFCIMLQKIKYVLTQYAGIAQSV